VALIDRVQVLVEADAQALAARAAEIVTVALGEACATRGEARWLLAGGSTPQALYRELAAGAGQPVVWSRVSLYWGDERVIRPDQPASNFGAAWSALSALRFDLARVHRIEAERGADMAAARYERQLHQELLGDGNFDLTLLGVGEDGHTASLFPGDAATHEERLWVRAARAPDVAPGAVGGGATAPAERVTLTFPALRRSRHTLFLVSGAAKAAIVRRVLAEGDGPSTPAGRASEEAPLATWLLDRAAAAGLDPLEDP
jgi:6-phosphogluconolactonase